MFQENSIETCIVSRMKQITSPDWMHETSSRTWCTGKTQGERVEREVGGGIGMGNTCKPMAVSLQCMTKFTTKKKKKTGQIILVAYEKWRTSCSSLIREIDIRLTSYQMENKQFQALGISQCKVEIFEEKQKQKTSCNLFTLSVKGDVPCVILESRKGICTRQSKTVLCFGAANTSG